MEWDKLWATNKAIIDPICPRYTAVRKDNLSTLTLINGPEFKSVTVENH